MDTTQMRTWAEISLPNLEHNYRVLRACIPAGCRFMGLVKANAYGHGAVPVARRLKELGAEYLAVACVEEAAQLRQAGVGGPLLILGAVPPGEMPLAVELGATVTVFEPEGARVLSRAATAAGKTVKVHIKADTGMSRLGFPAREGELERSGAEILAACALPGLEAEGIFTHFANADGDEAYTMLQFTRFLDTLAELEETYGRKFEIRHCAASGAVLNYPCTHLDMVRPGVALYGHAPDPSCAGLDELDLRPAMTLKSRVAAVRDLPGDTPVSYGCTQRVGRNGGRVAVLPIGYADGLHRVLSGRGSVWLDGKRRPIIGRVCMDMCMVALEDGDQVKAGDEAEIFGLHLPVEESAELAGTIQYELLCAVSARVPRVYL